MCAIADRLQTFLQDPSKWISFGLIGEMKEARNSRETGSGAKKSPMISVLLPVKGVHERTLMHWRSQVKASHGGPMEFIFCMESAEDPAHAKRQLFVLQPQHNPDSDMAAAMEMSAAGGASTGT